MTKVAEELRRDGKHGIVLPDPTENSFRCLSPENAALVSQTVVELENELNLFAKASK